LADYWLELAASNGHDSAVFKLNHQNAEIEKYKFESELLTSAEKGEPQGLYYKALMFIHYRCQESYVGECIDLLEESACKGGAQAQYFLGLIYETGRYIEKAQRGESTGRIFGPIPQEISEGYIPNIQSFVFFNKVSLPNQSVALDWYKKSAKQKYAPAIEKLEQLGIAPEAENNTNSTGETFSFDDYDIKFLFHMTHIGNLENILTHGLQPHGNVYNVAKIDNPDVNSRRSKFDPIFQKSLHEYVPFYFNPKNPMLSVNRDRQSDIVLLAFDKNLLMDDCVLFTDGNAASSRTQFFSKEEDLVNLNWKCLQANYWNDFDDGKRERMAEVLVPRIVKAQGLQKVICFNTETKKLIDNLNKGLITEINSNFYF
jgi:hypothetical protein